MQTPLVSTHWLHENLHDQKLIILEAQLAVMSGGSDAGLDNIFINNSRPFDLKGAFSNADQEMPNMLPKSQIFQAECRKLGINKDSKIVVYDKQGIYSSPRVWWMFKTMGHEQVAVLDGGLPKWVKDGFETVNDQKVSFEPGNYESSYQPELVRSQGDIIRNLDSKTYTVIDARSAGRFKGTAPEPREGLESGHIPGSKNIPYTEVLEDGQYKSKEELREVFNRLQLDDRPLVFSCGSGITACVIMLGAELVDDHPKAVYDGSWTEWALTEGLPIEKN